MQLVLTETNNKLLTQTDLVFNLENQIKNYDNMFIELESKYKTQSRLSEELETALRRQKNKTKLYKIGTYVGAAALGILIIK